ncbi:MAG: hypothetical protein WCP85_32105 [Mariniphaga sp.]
MQDNQYASLAMAPDPRVIMAFDNAHEAIADIRFGVASMLVNDLTGKRYNKLKSIDKCIKFIDEDDRKRIQKGMDFFDKKLKKEKLSKKDLKEVFLMCGKAFAPHKVEAYGTMKDVLFSKWTKNFIEFDDEEDELAKKVKAKNFNENDENDFVLASELFESINEF